MSHYHHLSIMEREKLHECRIMRKTISETARILGRSKSSISRELKRNGYRAGEIYYSPHKASLAYQKRRKNSRRPKILSKPENKDLVLRLFVENQWSPEQIANRLRYEGNLALSYGTIYRAIHAGILEPPGTYRNHGKRFPLERLLRHRKHRRGQVENRGKLQEPNHINERPLSAANRSRFGHFEADTLQGKCGSDFLVALVDRKGRYLLLKKCRELTSETVSEAMIEMLRPFSDRLKSITPDRGKEFRYHQRVSDALGTKLYYPDPHAPWQRPTVENTNGLLREYFPKGGSMHCISDDFVASVQDKLNFRPRKCLGWKTPYEVFFRKALHLT